jgi:hypothetical protein
MNEGVGRHPNAYFDASLIYKNRGKKFEQEKMDEEKPIELTNLTVPSNPN